MDDLVRFEIIRLPKCFIVGRGYRYSYDALDNGDNRLPAFWNECYKDAVFAPLESQTEYIYDDSHVGVFIDWHLGDNNFTYIIGLLMKEGAVVPSGYVIRELEETDAAFCMVKCKNLTETRAVPFGSAAKKIAQINRSCAGMRWCIDLYHKTRSTVPDENGCVILDCYIPLD